MINLEKLNNSFKYALEGLKYSIRDNQNIKIHLILAIFVLIFSLLLGLTKYEIFSVSLLIILVISAEMINTAIEEVVDLLVNEHRKEAKVAKDVGAGMVLLVSVFAGVVGFFIFIPHIILLFQ
ncbi:MAG TPA: diacylglycerol kinase family protein [Candidatus Sulfotelmatobacter sp.]|nr:diacylglycerol kinase family protein [Candidatus Sulfotelmatobacter sp.]